MCSRLRYYSKFPCIMPKNEISLQWKPEVPNIHKYLQVRTNPRLRLELKSFTGKKERNY